MRDGVKEKASLEKLAFVILQFDQQDQYCSALTRITFITFICLHVSSKSKLKHTPMPHVQMTMPIGNYSHPNVPLHLKLLRQNTSLFVFYFPWF